MRVVVRQGFYCSTLVSNILLGSLGTILTIKCMVKWLQFGLSVSRFYRIISMVEFEFPFVSLDQGQVMVVQLVSGYSRCHSHCSELHASHIVQDHTVEL